MTFVRQVTEIVGGGIHPGRDALFQHVDAFRFIGRGPGRLSVSALPLGTATVATVLSSGHDIALNEPAKASFLVPLQGRLSVETRAGSLAAADDGAMVLAPGRRMTAVRPSGENGFRAIVALVPARGRQHGAEAGRAFAAAGTDAAASALAGYLRFLVAESARPDSPLHRPSALRASEALILDLFDELDGAAWSPDRGERAAAERHVRMAEAFMHANADEPLTMTEVAGAVGVGVRALQAAFRALRGAAPRAVLQEMRLTRARSRLLAPDATASVTDIALLSGFAHFGRFAASYRARFGEPPSATLRRARR